MVENPNNPLVGDALEENRGRLGTLDDIRTFCRDLCDRAATAKTLPADLPRTISNIEVQRSRA
jgi:hypothetical protein